MDQGKTTASLQKKKKIQMAINLREVNLTSNEEDGLKQNSFLFFNL